MADFPEEAKWLTEEERSWVITRTGRNGDAPPKVVVKDILQFFGRFRNVLGGVLYFGKPHITLARPKYSVC